MAPKILMPAPKIGGLPLSPRSYYLIEEMDLREDDVHEYLSVATPYVPEFEQLTKFHLIAGGVRTPAPGRYRITHLWSMPEADSLRQVMEFLANDEQYGRIDRLVGRTKYECQDIAVEFGKVHGKIDVPDPTPKGTFVYVIAHHRLWTTDLNTYGWVFDFDAGFRTFVQSNRGWIHLGNRMKITGCIYDVFETWIAPARGPDPESVLRKSRWMTPGTTIDVFSPVPYDHNVSRKRTAHARKKRP